MLNNGEVFAGFTIERMLGQGGMGSVYLARHPRLPRQTALKLLNRELFADAEVRARFEREADLAAQLDHPNIVAVYDRGTEDEQLWISMQYIDGVDAATVNPQTLPPERAVQIIEGVAGALDYAHGMGVLHRDVKPANIMLARSDSGKRERVFLTDFGIARLREDSTHLTQTGMFTATLAYASPEQMTGAHLDHGSDQYSLACSLYWLLTGTGPFDAANPADIIRGHLQLAPPPVAARRPGVSPALDMVLARAMAKRPADRYPSCGDFAEAARLALTAPQPAYPPQPPFTPQAAPTMLNPAAQQPVSAPGYPQPYPAPAAQPAYAPQDAYTPPPAAQTSYAPPPAPAFASGAPSGYAPQPAAQFPSGPPPGSYPPVAPFAPNAGGVPPQRSNTGVIVGVAAVVVMLLAVVVGVVVATRGSDSPPPVNAGGTSSSPAAPGKPGTGAADLPGLAAAFPQLLPQDADTKYGIGSGDGYQSKKCFASTNKKGDDKLNTRDDVPAFPGWKVGWDCFGVPIDAPNFVVVAFDSPADAQAAVRGFPSNTKSSDTKSGKPVTTYRWQNTGAGYPHGVLAVSFENDPARSKYLFVAYITLTDSAPTSGLGLTSAKWKAWWSELPM